MNSKLLITIMILTWSMAGALMAKITIAPNATFAGIGVTADSKLIFCETAARQCFTVDPVSSEYESVPSPYPTDQEMPRMAAPEKRPAVTLTDEGIILCSGCPTYTPLGFTKDNFSADTVSAAGDLAVVIVQKNTIPHADVFMPKTAKRLSLIPLNNQSSCGSAEVLKKTIYGVYSYCAGPSDIAALYNPRTGRKIAGVGGVKEFPAFGTIPIHITGDVWAFNDAYGTLVAIQNVVSGAVLHRINLKRLYPRSVELPMTNPGGTAMFKIGGRLVVLFESPLAGTVLVINPHRGTIEKVIRPPK